MAMSVPFFLLFLLALPSFFDKGFTFGWYFPCRDVTLYSTRPFLPRHAQGVVRQYLPFHPLIRPRRGPPFAFVL